MKIYKIAQTNEQRSTLESKGVGDWEIRHLDKWLDHIFLADEFTEKEEAKQSMLQWILMAQQEDVSYALSIGWANVLEQCDYARREKKDEHIEID